MKPPRVANSMNLKLWVTEPKARNQIPHLSGHTIVCDKWLCKRDGERLTEVAAYQLADLLQAPTPEHRFFRYQHGIDSLSFPDDVGLLSRLRDLQRSTTYKAELMSDREIGFKFLLLNLLSTSEPPELYVDTQHLSFAIDLQFVLPDLDRNTLDDQLVIQRQLDWFCDSSSSSIARCLDHLGDSIPVNDFQEYITSVLKNIVPRFKPRFGGLTSEDTIANFFSRAFEGRLTAVLETIKELGVA